MREYSDISVIASLYLAQLPDRSAAARLEFKVSDYIFSGLVDGVQEGADRAGAGRRAWPPSGVSLGRRAPRLRLNA